ncbi:unnamed protein product, partial [Callosobruchus maculatus]
FIALPLKFSVLLIFPLSLFFNFISSPFKLPVLFFFSPQPFLNFIALPLKFSVLLIFPLSLFFNFISSPFKFPELFFFSSQPFLNFIALSLNFSVPFVVPHFLFLSSVFSFSCSLYSGSSLFFAILIFAKTSLSSLLFGAPQIFGFPFSCFLGNRHSFFTSTHFTC